MRRIGLLAALLFLSACHGSPGFETAVGCGFERRADLPIIVRQNLPSIQAEVNGVAVTMLLDTGAERTLVTEQAAARLGLSRDAQHVSRIVAVGAATTTPDAVAATLRLGPITLSDLRMLVGAFDLPAFDGARPDGVIGADILSHYDVDLDLLRGRLALYRPRDCPGTGPDWIGGYATLKAEVSARAHLIVPIALDGQMLSAMVDSASETTTIAPRILARFGLSMDGLARDRVIRVRGLTPALTPIRVHRFHSLRVGGLDYDRPYIPVSPLPDFVGDAVIGTDVLMTHRAWLSWSSGRVFLER